MLASTCLSFGRGCLGKADYGPGDGGMQMWAHNPKRASGAFGGRQTAKVLLLPWQWQQDLAFDSILRAL